MKFLLLILLFLYSITFVLSCHIIITYDTSLSVSYPNYLLSKNKMITMVEKLQNKDSTFTLINWSTRSYILFNSTNNLIYMDSIIQNIEYLGMGERIDRLKHILDTYNGIILSISDKKHNFNRKQLDICNSNICNDMILFEDILILRNKTCGNNIILFNLILNNNILIVDIETKYSDDYCLILYKDTIQINETIFYNYYENIYTYRYNLINTGVYKVCVLDYCSNDIQYTNTKTNVITTTMITVSVVLGVTMVTGGSIDNSIQAGQFISATSSLNTYQEDRSFSDSMSITNFGVGENIYQVLHTNETKSSTIYIIDMLSEPMDIFVNNILLLLIVLIVVYICSLIFNIIILKKQHKEFNKVYPENNQNNEKNIKVYKYVWKSIYKVLLFGFQSVVTSTILLFRKNEFPYEIVLSSIILVSILLFVFLVITIMSTCYKEKMMNKENKHYYRFYHMFSSLKDNHIYFMILFCMKDICIAMSIVLFDTYQVYFLFVLQLLFLLFVLYIRPFNNLKDNIIEIVNNLLCFIQVVLLLFLTIRKNNTIETSLLIIQISTVVLNCGIGLVESLFYCIQCIKRNKCKQ